MPLDPLHARVIRMAVALPEARTAALAGGGAMLAHGIVERATKDIDLFTDRDTDEAVRIIAALRTAVAEAGLHATRCSSRWGRCCTSRTSQRKDRGLTEDTFIVSLRMVRRFGDEEWADAGIDPARGAATRATILDWADRLDS